MKILKNNNLENMELEALQNLLTSFKEVHLDIGTGDGRFIYKNAKLNPENLYIGVDSSEKQMYIYLKKCLREKLNNVLFVLSAIENLPKELTEISDMTTLILPWGTLLQSVSTPNHEVVAKISNTIKQNGKLQIILGYAKESEPSETERLTLNDLTTDHINNFVIPVFEKNNMELKKISLLEKTDLKKVESTWSKKLTFGKERPIYFIELTKKSR